MNNYKEITDSLSNCVQACEACATACLKEENIKKLSRCINLDRDCADICSLGVQLLSRKSEISHSLISLCADICARCAEECENHEHDHCRKCAEACRHCEEICKTFLDHARQAAMNA